MRVTHTERREGRTVGRASVLLKNIPPDFWLTGWNVLQWQKPGDSNSAGKKQDLLSKKSGLPLLLALLSTNC